MTPQRRWQPLGDGPARMAYVRLGTPGAVPVVMVPGLGDGLAPLFADGVVESLPKLPAVLARHEVVLVSHRSPMARWATSAGLASDLVHFLHTVVGRPAVVAGHSLGAMVAQHVTASRPDLVDRLVLSSTLLRADRAFATTLHRWQRWLDAGAWRRFHRDATARSYTGSVALRRLLATAVGPVHRPAPLLPRHRALTHACVTHDASGVAPAIARPTLVLVGTADRLTPPRHARALAAALPAATVRELPGLGHGFPEQAPRRFLAAFADFVGAPG